MNIIAVIPARAGSKGVPNKNIRIIGNHPLVYYSINNAKKSSFINRVIVSTDSPEVKTIANQMQVEVKDRSAELCGDSVTLDSVIYDAIKDYECDYVVTMQPTSPTLKVETLDAAIKYMIDNDLDTVISVINKPHLTWKKEGDKVVPNYKERLNRQYLPPCYFETGAFVISKRSIVTPQTRIGNKVNVYEISEEESKDIDSFDDLLSAGHLLRTQKVAIYVNGNNKRGVGHIYRALEIADEFYCKPDIYFDINQTDKAIFGNTTHNIKPVDGINELFKICEKEQYTIFINDILSTSIDYMIGLRSVLPNAKIINFEDDGEGQTKADLVFNALLNTRSFPNVYIGEKYYICGKLFLFYEPIPIKEQVERVFISFGGADPRNYTDRVLNIITKNDYFKKYKFVVALGRAKHNVEELMKLNSYDNIEILYDVRNMPELMSSCDIAITSRGRTGYELALLGIPCIAMAQNEREETHTFISNENGYTYIGLNPDDEVIEATIKMYVSLSKETRTNFQNKLLAHDFKNGRKRVMSLINNL